MLFEDWTRRLALKALTCLHASKKLAMAAPSDLQAKGHPIILCDVKSEEWVAKVEVGALLTFMSIPYAGGNLLKKTHFRFMMVTSISIFHVVIYATGELTNHANACILYDYCKLVR